MLLITVYFYTALFRQGYVDAAGKAVLITGCDTGFGNQLAKALDGIGYQVYAGLWAVVNNAGTSTFGQVEWNTMEIYKFVSEVNLFGTIRITKAFLPLIRQAKGRVVNVASGLARQSAAGRSPYVVSKYGVEGFSQCLRYEMKKWGVHVSIIEPGNFIAATNIFTDESIKRLSTKLWNGMKPEVQEAYGREEFDKSVRTMRNFAENGVKDTSPVVNGMKDAVTSKYPKTRYEIKDLYWHIRTFIMLHLPEVVGDKLYHSI
ncbi:D-beta-hydroxybutyrate dehydrogenase, mitochondrial-like isoform X2 [Anneissia japonica]|uniref:D-beta-hydroxybutyrate dehydrogenase, mitochondrial-like isoform X2 n=1 Tax=Anneissia japonica TaxID=1529436 RepID=UPI001425A49C|nr:D-beta-hydroxybutyrate dehydrogenase, mitochondrial-like isoform X2 [Anneissia japonica]